MLSVALIMATGCVINESDSNEIIVEETLPECKRSTLSCGESGVACGATIQEVDDVIEEAEAHYCG